MTAEQYLAQLQALLPQGAAWPREEGSTLGQLLLALADELSRVDARGEMLLDEADPRITSELLADWERVAGLPDPCVGANHSTAQRIASLIQKLTALGGQSVAYYISIAAALGFSVTVSEFDVHDVGAAVNDPMYGAAWQFAWQVNAPLNTVGYKTVADTVADPMAWWGNEQIECVIRGLRPAHTHVLFTYA